MVDISGTLDLQGSITVDAAGNGNVRFEGPFNGDWYVQRAVFTKPGTPNGTEVASLYVGSVDDAGLRDRTSVVAFPSVIADESSSVRVPTSTPVFGGVTGGTPNDRWTVTLQIGYPESTLEDGTSDWADKAGDVDSLLWPERGFPNQRRIPIGKR